MQQTDSKGNFQRSLDRGQVRELNEKVARGEIVLRTSPKLDPKVTESISSRQESRQKKELARKEAETETRRRKEGKTPEPLRQPGAAREFERLQQPEPTTRQEFIASITARQTGLEVSESLLQRTQPEEPAQQTITEPGRDIIAERTSQTFFRPELGIERGRVVQTGVRPLTTERRTPSPGKAGAFLQRQIEKLSLKQSEFEGKQILTGKGIETRTPKPIMALGTTFAIAGLRTTKQAVRKPIKTAAILGGFTVGGIVLPTVTAVAGAGIIGATVFKRRKQFFMARGTLPTTPVINPKELARLSGEIAPFAIAGGIISGGAGAIAGIRTPKAVTRLRFAKSIKGFEQSIPKLSVKQTRTLLRVGGIKTRTGQIQTTFGKGLEVISADRAARIRVQEFTKSPLKRPGVPGKVTVIPTITRMGQRGPAIVALERGGRFDVSKFGDISFFKQLRQQSVSQKVLLRDFGVQTTLPKFGIGFKLPKAPKVPFRTLPAPSKIIKTPKPVTRFTRKGGVDTLDLGRVQTLQARQKGPVIIDIMERPFPRQEFKTMLEGRTVPASRLILPKTITPPPIRITPAISGVRARKQLRIPSLKIGAVSALGLLQKQRPSSIMESIPTQSLVRITDTGRISQPRQIQSQGVISDVIPDRPIIPDFFPKVPTAPSSVPIRPPAQPGVQPLKIPKTFIPDLDFPRKIIRKKLKKKKKLKRFSRFQPSVVAIDQLLRGRTPGPLTGLEIRRIPIGGI